MRSSGRRLLRAPVCAIGLPCLRLSGARDYASRDAQRALCFSSPQIALRVRPSFPAAGESAPPDTQRDEDGRSTNQIRALLARNPVGVQAPSVPQTVRRWRQAQQAGSLTPSREKAPRMTDPLTPETIQRPRTPLNAGVPKKKENRFVTDLARIMTAVRTTLYCPDGQPPAKSDPARDASIAKQWLKHDSADRIVTAIEGFGKLRDKGTFAQWIMPRQKATLRALNLPINGGPRFFELCVSAGLQPVKREGMASLGRILREAAAHV